METKKQLIEKITEFLKGNSKREIYIVKYQNKLRNGRWGLHAYTICFDSGEVMCRPWSGANVYWRADLKKLTKVELLDIAKNI